MTSTDIYCTYVTTYSGNKLPPFYIGSTSVNKIVSGYRGSVGSKKWKQIYKEELLNSPEKFRIEIIETFATRKEALDLELKLQIANDVVKSKWFFNEALASVNGFFGRSMTGENNTFFGQKHTDESMAKMKEGRLKVRASKRTIWMHNVYNVNARIKEEMINEAYAQGYLIGYAKGTTNLNRKGIKMKCQKNKLKYINNGIMDRKIKMNDEVPSGWFLGCTKGYKMKPRIDIEPTQVITNGICTKRIKISAQIPDGWRLGRHYSTKSKSPS